MMTLAETRQHLRGELEEISRRELELIETNDLARKGMREEEKEIAAERLDLIRQLRDLDSPQRRIGEPEE